MTKINDKEVLDKVKTEAIEYLQEGLEALETAYESLMTAKSLIRDLPTDYNMSGNMEAYVINYIKDGSDSLIDKVEEYISELKELELNT